MRDSLPTAQLAMRERERKKHALPPIRRVAALDRALLRAKQTIRDLRDEIDDLREKREIR